MTLKRTVKPYSIGFIVSLLLVSMVYCMPLMMSVLALISFTLLWDEQKEVHCMHCVLC